MSGLDPAPMASMVARHLRPTSGIPRMGRRPRCRPVRLAQVHRCLTGSAGSAGSAGSQWAGPPTGGYRRLSTAVRANPSCQMLADDPFDRSQVETLCPGDRIGRGDALQRGHDLAGHLIPVDRAGDVRGPGKPAVDEGRRTAEMRSCPTAGTERANTELIFDGLEVQVVSRPAFGVGHGVAGHEVDLHLCVQPDRYAELAPKTPVSP